MTDLAPSTVAFLDAMRLEEGGVDKYDFATPKEADSFRVALYAVKRKLRDNTVLISISHATIALTKKSSVVKRTRYAPDGSAVEIPPDANETEYQKQVNVIIKDSEDFPKHLRADYIKDALEVINAPYRRTN